MNQELSRLYQRICDYSPDDGESALTFTRRLARDNGWNMKYAARVVEEYKKFMFLAVAAGHPVTPSEQVDQAWHLHLIYTRSYWDEFCGQVLGTPIHHGPTKGGADEQAAFHDLYERTKSSYRQLLDETPPPDIWPDAEQRFGDDVDCVRVNTRSYWIVPKRLAQHYALGTLAAAILVVITGYARHEEKHLEAEAPSQPAMSEDSHVTIRPAVWNQKDRTELFARQHSDIHPLPLPTTKPNYLVLWGLAIGVAVAVCIGITAMFRGKCSSCGRTHALTKTGNTEQGTGWLASTKDEWQCKYCGATIWTTHYTACGGSCGAGGGCGGSSDCGNSGCAGSGCGGGGCGGGGCGGGGCGGG
jgi:hypothetical protein